MRSKAVPSVVRKFVEVGGGVVLVILVDGLVVFTHGQAALEQHFIAELDKRFPIKALKEASYFLGCHIAVTGRIGCLGLTSISASRLSPSALR